MASTLQRIRLRWMVVILVLAAAKPVAAADLQYPLSVAVAETKAIYLADRNLPGIWKLSGESLVLFFQGSRQFRTPLNAVRCVAVDRAGRLLAGDSATREVYRFNDQGHPIGLTGKPTPAGASPTGAAHVGPPGNAGAEERPNENRSPGVRPAFGQIGIPMDIAVSATGDLLVSDLETQRLVRIPEEGGDVTEFTRVPAPHGLSFDDGGNLWCISGRRLVKIPPDGKATTIVDEGIFEFPHCVAVATDGTAYVSDGYAQAIWKISPGSRPEKLVQGPPLVNPVGMRLVGDALLVVDPHARSLFRVTFDGKISLLPLSPAKKQPG